MVDTSLLNRDAPVHVGSSPTSGTYTWHAPAPLRNPPSPLPKRPYPGAWLDLRGDVAAEAKELLMDINQWYDDGVTGLTQVVMDWAYEQLLEPLLPVVLNMPSGKVEPFNKPHGPVTASVYMPTEDENKRFVDVKR